LGETIARQVSDAENETALRASLPHRGAAAGPVGAASHCPRSPVV